MKIFVYGVGEIGEYLINLFNNHQVLICDKNLEEMEIIAEKYGVEYVDYNMIQDIEMDFDYVFLTSDDISINVMLAILSLSKGCKNIYCYIDDDSYRNILEKINVKALSKTEIAKNMILRSFKEPLYNAIYSNLIDVIPGKNYSGKTLLQIKNALFVISENKIIKEENYIINEKDFVVVKAK